MCPADMGAKKPGTGVFLPPSCILQASNSRDDDDDAAPAIKPRSNTSSPRPPVRAMTPPSPGVSAAASSAAATDGGSTSSTVHRSGSWFNGMTFSAHLPPTGTGGRHSLVVLVERHAAAASGMQYHSSSGGRYECAGTLLDMLGQPSSAAPMALPVGQHTGVVCSTAGLATALLIPQTVQQPGISYINPSHTSISNSRLFAPGQVGFVPAGCVVVSAAPAVGDLAQQMYQMQLAGAAPQQCHQPSNLDAQLALMQQQMQHQHNQQQQQFQQPTSLDTQLALMQQQQLQQQQLQQQQPSSLDTQLDLMQQQPLLQVQHRQHQQHQQQRRRNSCSLPVGDRECYRLFGSTGNITNLEPVLEEVQVQEERMTLADIEQELMLLMQAQQQEEAGGSAPYGAFNSTTGIASGCNGPTASLQVGPSEWSAAAIPQIPAQTAPMQQFPAAVDNACLTDQGNLQAYMALHQQQQMGHQLCMQSVSNTRKQHGRLSDAAHAKLAQLLAVQQMQMQMQIQEELMVSLLPGNEVNMLQT